MSTRDQPDTTPHCAGCLSSLCQRYDGTYGKTLLERGLSALRVCLDRRRTDPKYRAPRMSCLRKLASRLAGREELESFPAAQLRHVLQLYLKTEGKGSGSAKKPPVHGSGGPPRQHQDVNGSDGAMLDAQADQVGAVGSGQDRTELAAALDAAGGARNLVLADGIPYPIVQWPSDGGGHHGA